MKLSEILKGLSYNCSNFTDCEIKDIAYDSRKCGEGILFVCLVGAFTDGHKYIQSAYEKGSRFFLCEIIISAFSPDKLINYACITFDDFNNLG